MPLKGLRAHDPMFPKIGDIRKGAPKGPDGKIGKDLDYFRYAPIPGEETAAARFASVFGDEPRELDVILPFDDVDRNFEAYMERNTAGALQCRGDIEGERAYMWRDERTGEMCHTVKDCPIPQCKGCKESGRLRVIIPALRRGGYVVVHTTSKWDILELYANLRAIAALNGGGLTGIPMVLKRRPRIISTPRGNGQRVRMEKWLLSVEADPRWVEAKIAAMQRAALPTTEPIALLKNGVSEDILDRIIREEDEWDEEGEFVPDEANPTQAVKVEAEAETATSGGDGRKAVTRDTYLAHYAALVDRATVLSISTEPLPENATYRQIEQAGLDLKAAIELREAAIPEQAQDEEPEQELEQEVLL